MKNWQPFVFGPLLTIDTTPALVCLRGATRGQREGTRVRGQRVRVMSADDECGGDGNGAIAHRGYSLQPEVLVAESAFVDRVSPRPVVVNHVPALDHDVREDAGEFAALVAQPTLELTTHALLARAKGAKVLARDWRDGRGQLDQDAAFERPVDCDVEKDDRLLFLFPACAGFQLFQFAAGSRLATHGC